MFILINGVEMVVIHERYVVAGARRTQDFKNALFESESRI